MPVEERSRRLDLRHVCVCSVDPPGCKDIDDALSLEVLENGNYRVRKRASKYKANGGGGEGGGEGGDLVCQMSACLVMKQRRRCYGSMHADLS